MTPTAIFPTSLRDTCPRTNCGATMTTRRVESFEIVACPHGHYSYTQTTGELKAEFAQLCRLACGKTEELVTK